jgi:hypothetical protein
VGTRTESDPRFEVQYNAQTFAILAEQLLLSEGVDILYGSYVVDAAVKDERIESLTVVNKSGHTKYFVKSAVDATGDCDIAHFCAAPTAEFQQGNVLAAWYYFADKEGYHLRQHGFCDIPEEERRGRELKHLNARRFSGLSGKEISEQTILSHAATMKDYLAIKEKNPDAVIATIATIPQVRMTRRIVGEKTLTYDELHTYKEDSIGMVSNWKRRGPVWEVPFGTLWTPSVKNLAVAGRCTSVDERLWDVMRVIPCCAVTGEAAGTAAAISDDFGSLDIAYLQRILEKNGVVLHENDLKKR